MLKTCLLLISLFGSNQIRAVAIAISKTRNLTFTKATSQEPAQILVPASITSSQFTVTGDANRIFTITFPSGTKNMTNGSNTIAATTWTSDTTTPTTLNGTGTKIISIGATRSTVPTGAAVGLYTGSHSVTVRYSSGGTSKTATASHLITIIQSIALSVTQGISFPDAFRGDIAATIVPGGTGQAILTVQGQANTPYTITLPAPNTITMTRVGGSGGATDSIIIQSFSSSPSGSGVVGAGGTQSISVGCIRSAILSNQVIGDYSGTFTVRVTYQ